MANQGIDECREELEDIVDMLKNTDKYLQMGARIPKGVLLSGKPGVGKTMLAKALVHNAGCNWIYRSGSSFDEMFVGVGASRVKAMFEMAKQRQPAIIFIDEFDSIGGKRDSEVSNDPNSSINQLLTLMDGWTHQIREERPHHRHRLDQLP